MINGFRIITVHSLVLLLPILILLRAKKDSYLDKADEFANKADSLETE